MDNFLIIDISGEHHFNRLNGINNFIGFEEPFYKNEQINRFN